MTGASPRIHVRRATKADADAILDIHFAAFLPSATNRLMFPNGVTPDARVKFGQSLFPEEPATGDGAAQKPSGDSGPETIVTVAELLPDSGTEGDAGEVIAFAKWVVYYEPRPREVWDAPRTPMTVETLGEGVNVDVYERFIGEVREMRKKWMKGEPGVLLDILASSPARGRMGAGSALLRWGLDFADQKGLDSWLESSPTGYPLYRRFGFEDVDVQDLPVTELWGVTRKSDEDWGSSTGLDVAGPLPEGAFRTVLMKRAAKKGK
ncbi:hypothetical protein VTK73DRAFT_6008 [Phialemonium thermophilum]|uniref:N-acetyltransferase domain-containing protein n=1 Tax=Phialemonium thermophilum TaxID=223376 RepID=A0ABR3WLA2_9PEZI